MHTISKQKQSDKVSILHMQSSIETSARVDLANKLINWKRGAGICEYWVGDMMKVWRGEVFGSWLGYPPIFIYLYNVMWSGYWFGYFSGSFSWHGSDLPSSLDHQHLQKQPSVSAKWCHAWRTKCHIHSRTPRGRAMQPGAHADPNWLQRHFRPNQYQSGPMHVFLHPPYSTG